MATRTQLHVGNNSRLYDFPCVSIDIFTTEITQRHAESYKMRLLTPPVGLVEYSEKDYYFLEHLQNIQSFRMKNNRKSSLGSGWSPTES